MATIETLRVIHFDARKNVLAVGAYPGEPSCVIVPFRSIIAEALRLGTVGRLLSHNHPSGDPEPNRADILATHALARVGEALGISVHDHLVVGASSCVSFRDTGLL